MAFSAWLRNARNASRSSASEPKLAWWSSSTFVNTPISTFRLNIERSDSSASTTSHSPCTPAARSACTSIDAVVVFPCVPATAIVRFSAVSSASNSARGRSGRPRSRAASRSGLSAGTALE